MSKPFDIIIIGSGIVGCSTAYQLLNQNPLLNILILDKEDDCARHQTGHNSGVMHSGIYYKPGSYKALNCIKGYGLLKSFCDNNDIPYKLIGKLIIAANNREQLQLKKIFNNGILNGLKGIELLNLNQIKELEPNARGVEAIRVPQAGIVDYTKVVQKLKEIIQNKGGTFLFNKKVQKINVHHPGLEIICSDDSSYKSNFLINCAGLQSDRIAREAGLHLPYRIIPFKGNYYKLCDQKKEIVNHLIYPVPDPQFPFLGIHYTKMMNRDQTLGPNAILSFDREGYQPNSFNLNDAKDIFLFQGFWKLIKKHWTTGMDEYRKNYSIQYFAQKASELTPGITTDDLSYYNSGIRAQLIDNNGQMVEDFISLKTNKMIHVINAPSPAATAGLAIGQQISDWYFEMQHN